MASSLPHTEMTLADHADVIRKLGKRAIRDVIEIGRRLVDAKRIAGHGNWLPWLEREFGWSDSTALRFMQVHELAKSVTVTDLDIPIRGLYLLAAPSTPDEARDEVIARARSGEALSVDDIRSNVDEVKAATDKEPASPTVNALAEIGKKPRISKAAQRRLDALAGFVGSLPLYVGELDANDPAWAAIETTELHKVIRKLQAVYKHLNKNRSLTQKAQHADNAEAEASATAPENKTDTVADDIMPDIPAYLDRRPTTPEKAAG